MRVLTRPFDMIPGRAAAAAVEAGLARPLLGGRFACTTVERILVQPHGAPTRELRAALDPVAALAPAFVEPRHAPFDRPRLMGIVNVTPDSFSDGGLHGTADAAFRHGMHLLEAGADIVEIGGESTRPGSLPVAANEELRRVVPVVERLAAAGAVVSVDTRKAAVMRAALSAGASIVNDVSGLTHDPEALAVAAGSSAHVILMHMRGHPATMNEAPDFRDVVIEVHDELAGLVARCEAAGLPRDRLLVDPGLCFGKHEAHNLALLGALSLLHGLGCPVALGASRKGWTASVEQARPPARRVPASLAAMQWGLERGACLFRVHDVAEARQALLAWTALAGLDAG